MSINAETGVYICHDCGASGNAVDEFLSGMDGFFRYKINREHTVPVNNMSSWLEKIPKWEGNVPLPGELVELGELKDSHPARQYLHNRGISLEVAGGGFGLMYCKEGYFKFMDKLGTTSGRIIFPIYSEQGLEGWQARVVDGTCKSGRRRVWKGEKEEWFYPVKLDTGQWSDVGVPKYYTCPMMQRSRILYNYQNAIKQGSDLVVVVEGPVDCIKVGQKCVATIGSKISTQQTRIIKSRWSNVVWILDRGIDTQSEWFIKTEEDLRDGLDQLHIITLDCAEDPGAATQQEIWKEIREKTNS